MEIENQPMSEESLIPEVHQGDSMFTMLHRFGAVSGTKIYLAYNAKYRFSEALIHMPDYCVCMCKAMVVIIRKSSNEMIRLYALRKQVIAGEIDLQGVQRNVILDLNTWGERWEGDVLDGIPCGWGCFYDEVNQRLYDGFMIGNRKMYYGTEYYANRRTPIQYQGGWINNKLFGVGVFFDLKGNVECSGEWISSRLVVNAVAIAARPNLYRSLHSLLTDLTIAKNTSAGRTCTCLDLSGLSSLRTLSIGENCFKSILEFRLCAQSNLVSIVIGRKSFSKARAYSDDNPSIFQVSQCTSLQSLVIHEGAFCSFSTFSLSALPSLKQLSIGGLGKQPCFDWCRDFQLCNFPALHSVQIGSQCFRLIRSVIFRSKLCFDGRI